MKLTVEDDYGNIRVFDDQELKTALMQNSPEDVANFIAFVFAPCGGCGKAVLASDYLGASVRDGVYVEHCINCTD